MTTLQREVLFLVMLIASLATAIAVLLVILWAAWCVSASIFYPLCLHASVRLRRSYPSYINVSGLLIDIVSIMGKSIQSAEARTAADVVHSRLLARWIVGSIRS